MRKTHVLTQAEMDIIIAALESGDIKARALAEKIKDIRSGKVAA